MSFGHGAGMFYRVIRYRSWTVAHDKRYFFGYESSSKGYKLWDEDLRRMVVSRSVRFDGSVADTVAVDTDSEAAEEARTVFATEVKSVPV